MVGSWGYDEESPTVNMIFTADKTLISPDDDEIGAWEYYEEKMELCIGDSKYELDECVLVMSIDDNTLCIKEGSTVRCVFKK